MRGIAVGNGTSFTGIGEGNNRNVGVRYGCIAVGDRAAFTGIGKRNDRGSGFVVHCSGADDGCIVIVVGVIGLTIHVYLTVFD